MLSLLVHVLIGGRPSFDIYSVSRLKLEQCHKVPMETKHPKWFKKECPTNLISICDLIHDMDFGRVVSAHTTPAQPAHHRYIT